MRRSVLAPESETQSRDPTSAPTPWHPAPASSASLQDIVRRAEEGLLSSDDLASVGAYNNMLANHLVRLDQAARAKRDGETAAAGRPDANHLPSSAKFEKVPGTLWAKDARGNDLPPGIEDIHQDTVGDCFLFAALVAVVSTDPARIARMIKDNLDGTYTVAFRGIGILHAHKEVVTAMFIKGHRAKPGPRHALWPLIIETAYEQARGGFEKIDLGGNGGDAISDLIAEGPSRFDPRNKDPRWIIGKLAYAHIKKYPTVALTLDKAAPEATQRFAAAVHLHLSHTYAVLDVRAAKQLVYLFNPWGELQPGKHEDGWVEVDVLHSLCDEIDINS